MTYYRFLNKSYTTDATSEAGTENPSGTSYWHSEAINQGMTDNAMANGKGTKR